MSKKYTIYDDNLKLFDAMTDDIRKAKRNIFLETFRFGKDSIGEKFRLVLYQKAKEGVEIKLLLDAWGTGRDLSFFQPLIEAGVEVRLYRKVRLTRGILAKNHCRNHRKFLIIDSEIAYMGSSNITAYSINWRELNLRTTDRNLIKVFRRSFRDSYRNYNKYDIPFVASYKTYHFGKWSFIQDYPDTYRQRVKSKYEKMIQEAKEEVIVETPYFLPGHQLRKELVDAAKRGVNVKVLIPYNSDVRVVDIIRRHYLGKLYEEGVKFNFYLAGNLHAKSLMIDGKVFSISSSNFDYRSFRYQYEIALIGEENDIISQLTEHHNHTMKLSKDFDYDNWKKRPGIDKIIEYILLPFRYLM
ncbi:MAG: phosphatidylserine/phosphatidylglycerophosphate/cardiolipin synthase family protein [Bacteroidales bacterium]|nr:phosphatidylserine/phosphatidylglycerophosphate/cardiolipin synthase family protein [Bacteroidales bacterium]